MAKKEKNVTNTMKVMEEKNIQKVASSQKVGKVFGQIAVYTFLGIMALIAKGRLRRGTV